MTNVRKLDKNSFYSMKVKSNALTVKVATKVTMVDVSFDTFVAVIVPHRKERICSED